MDIATFLDNGDNNALKSPKAPTVFVYHGFCNDGTTAVAIAKYHYVKTLGRTDYSTIPAIHQKAPFYPDFEGKTVVFLDFCYPLEIMKKILEVADTVTVLDHHVSAYEELKDFEHDKFTYVYDVSRCGASITWQVLYPNHKEPLFVEFINDRDLWLNKSPSSEYASLALRTKYADSADFIELVTNVIDEWFTHSTHKITFSLVEAGRHYKYYHDALVKQIKSNAFEVILDDGQAAMMCYAPMAFASDVGAQLAREFTGVAIIAEQHENYTKYSMRVAENCDYDSSIYATSKGGGGHKKASGYTEIKL